MTTIDYAEFDIEAAGGSDQYRACRICEVPMQTRSSAPLKPGFVHHASAGLCTGCDRWNRRQQRHDEAPELTIDVLARDTHLAGLIFGRRMRGVPAEGWAA